MQKSVSLFTIFVMPIMLPLPSGSLHVANVAFSTILEIINSTGDGI